ncbi:MAG TPA: thioredoxin family protein [Bacilli bacterium]
MKKLMIYLAVIVALFAAMAGLKALSDSKLNSTDNPYHMKASQLSKETRAQFDDPNYQNIILPDELKAALDNKESLFVYFFQPTCPHCKITTPIVNPLAKQVGIDLKQFNLLEFRDGWLDYNIEGTPTIVYYKDGKEVDRLYGGAEEEPGDGGHTEQDFIDFFQKYK